jgi:predicted kinase
VDATFRRRAHRAAFAEALGGRALFVECLAPAAVVAERAARRELDPERVSDATAEIAARQRAEFEPLDEVTPGAHLRVRTDRPVEELLGELEAWLDARLPPLDY